MPRIVFSTVLTAFAAFALAATAWSAPQDSAVAPGAALDSRDQEFLKKAATVNMMEMELGKAAQRLSQNEAIRKHAESIVRDHSASQKELEALAEKKGFSLPTQLPEADRSALARLEEKQGEAFDKAFLDFSQKGHQNTIALFERALSRSQDADVKAWAEKTLPVLRQHLAMTQQEMGGKTEPVGEKVGEKLKKEMRQILPGQQQQPDQQKRQELDPGEHWNH